MALNHSSAYNLQMNLMQRNLSSMLKNKASSDVVIECDGEEFYVHKFVLVMASDYFEKMFANNFQESSTNRIKFPTLKKEIMKIIIDFLYLSETPLPTDQNVVVETYKAAHSLDLKPLIDYCSKRIVEELSLENYLAIWRLMNAYQDDHMIAGLSNFLLKNLQEVMTCDDFLLLNVTSIKFLIKTINDSKIKANDFMIQNILNWIKQNEERKTYLLELFTSFIDIDISFGFINDLINNEPLIISNAEILTMFLKIQLKIEKTSENVVCRQLVKNSSKNQLTYLPSSIPNYTISPTKKLPFKITNGMAYISNGDFIYFIGGDNEIGNSGESFSKRDDHYGRGSTSIIRYNVNTCTDERTTPLLYAVFNPTVFIDNGKLHVFGKNSYDLNDPKTYIQSCQLTSILEKEPWTLVEASDDFVDVKFFCCTNNSVYYLKSK